MLLCDTFSFSLIISFKAEGLENDEEFKVDWKQVEGAVKKNYPGLKLVYSRADPKEGQLALSQLRIKEDLIESLLKTQLQIQDKMFSFKKLEDEELKEFWKAQGSHYNMCIQKRLRAAIRQNKQEKNDGAKRAKTSYEIAGVYYLDINKVKSKSRAILNLK